MIFLLFVFVSLVYVLLIFWIMRPTPALNDAASGQNLCFSVIIAARNEEDNIRSCLESLLQQDYNPELYEIIVVDDHSTDHTAAEINLVPGAKYLQLKDAQGKKAALTYGIMAAKNPYIAVTDADCRPGKKWLHSIDSLFRSSGAEFITGPVAITLNGSALAAFEAMDAAMMMAVTARGIHKKAYYLSNGANMAFKKDAFIELQGFSGNQQYASGDDVFLFRDAATQEKKIAYLKDKEGLVYTMPQMDFAGLLAQRKRWATKTKAYAGATILGIQGVVALTNALLFAGLFFSWFCPVWMKGTLVLLFAKWTTDYFALRNATKWQNNEKCMRFFIVGQFIYMIIILYSTIAVFFQGQYEWKNRRWH